MQQKNHRLFRDAAELHQATMFLHENGKAVAVLYSFYRTKVRPTKRAKETKKIVRQNGGEKKTKHYMVVFFFSLRQFCRTLFRSFVYVLSRLHGRLYVFILVYFLVCRIK